MDLSTKDRNRGVYQAFYSTRTSVLYTRWQGVKDDVCVDPYRLRSLHSAIGAILFSVVCDRSRALYSSVSTSLYYPGASVADFAPQFLPSLHLRAVYLRASNVCYGFIN